MFIKLSVIFFIVPFTVAVNENHDWDLAVLTNDRIELLLSNGSLAGEPFGHFNEFTRLRALTFDNVRHQFIVSDMNQQNDTIFTVQLTEETDITPIIKDLPDDVQGLAVDPITDTLYWTDSVNRTINYIHLNDSEYQSKILFWFTDERPQDIAIDVCHRYIYWTNSDINKPSIDRARLDGTERAVLVDSGLHRPAGLAVDYYTQRLFWADIKEGIYFTIESTNLEGKERQIILEGTHSKPFGVAVDSESIYWTDMNSNVIWMISKYNRETVPKQIRYFMDKPMGIIAKNVQIKALPDCEILSKAEATYNRTTEVFKIETDKETEIENICFNGGYLNENKKCHCLRGFAGEFCEVSLCHNYCVHGDCYTSNLGYPQCHCLRGFGGKRCEIDMCEGHCLNGGVCSRTMKLGEFPVCTCPEGFIGSRCEIILDICEVFCQAKENDLLMSKKEILCRCVDGFPEAAPKSNFTSLPLLSKQEPEFFFDHFQDSAFLALCCLAIIMLVIIIILSAYTCSLRRRPRIKKRIIVNKNVTPLTYRPQPATEQCEITIENCCNMNICETPCFEPPKLQCMQNKNEDKKKLLSNMENGEELY